MTKKVSIPKTKKECFALLDEMLSKEDKEAIVQMEDTIELHFTLGLWIRNNWIYNQTEEEIKALLKEKVKMITSLYTQTIIHQQYLMHTKNT